MQGKTNHCQWTLSRRWLDPSESQLWKIKLEQRLTWEQPIVRVYGKNHLTPRKTTFIGESSLKYKYSGFVHRAFGWPKWFLPLLNKINKVIGVEYNGCLLNFYRNGDDRMGLHSDNEKEIDREFPITSLSLGATRELFLINKKNKEKHVLSLMDGDLLIMHPGCQDSWAHSLPRRKKYLGSRINLTFRRYSQLAFK